MSAIKNIYFHPQSISNRNIHFQNGEQDKIKYSYTGTFSQRGVDFEEISLSTLSKICTSCWNQIFMNNLTHEKLDKEQLALRLKFFYVQRNFHALNAIIKTKNQLLAETDKKGAKEITSPKTTLIQPAWIDNGWIKVAYYILKAVTFCQFDLIQYLHRKYDRIQLIPKAEPFRYPELRTHVTLAAMCHISFINSIEDESPSKKADENNKEFFARLRIKGQPDPQTKKEKEKQFYKAWRELVIDPQAKLEDQFYLEQEMPGYDFESLYKMDLPNAFHGSYVNGHMVDPEYTPSKIPDEKNGYMLGTFNRMYERYCDTNVPRYFPLGEE